MQVMRSIPYSALVTLAVCGLVWAQEPAPAPATPTSTEAAAQDDATAAEGAKPADGEDTATNPNEVDEATPPPSKDEEASSKTAPAATTRKPASATGSPQRFEPTEKVRPDFDVAFPVDI